MADSKPLKLSQIEPIVGSSANFVSKLILTDTYTPVVADSGTTIYFDNVASCTLLPYDGTPPDGWNVRLIPTITDAHILTGILATTVGNNVADLYRSDNAEIILQYTTAVGWYITGAPVTYVAADPTLGDELAPTLNDSNYVLTSTDANNTFSVTGGTATLDSDTTSIQLRAEGVFEIGREYEISLNTVSQSGAEFRTLAGNGDTILSNLAQPVRIIADQTRFDLLVVSSTASQLVFDSISIREVLISDLVNEFGDFAGGLDNPDSTNVAGFAGEPEQTAELQTAANDATKVLNGTTSLKVLDSRSTTGLRATRIAMPNDAPNGTLIAMSCQLFIPTGMSVSVTATQPYDSTKAVNAMVAGNDEWVRFSDLITSDGTQTRMQFLYNNTAGSGNTEFWIDEAKMTYNPEL